MKEVKMNDWIQKVPFLKFPRAWEVSIVPPFAGAVVRFFCRKGDKQVSVYLDCYDNLGFVGEPYWEIYPAHHGDTERFMMHETTNLLKAISKALRKTD